MTQYVWHLYVYTSHKSLLTIRTPVPICLVLNENHSFFRYNYIQAKVPGLEIENEKEFTNT